MKELLSDPDLTSKYTPAELIYPLGNERKRKIASRMFTQ